MARKSMIKEEKSKAETTSREIGSIPEIRRAMPAMTSLARLRALELRVARLPAMKWDAHMAKAQTQPSKSPSERAQTALAWVKAWDASDERAALAHELSRLVALAVPRGDAEPADIVLPMLSRALRSKTASEGGTIERGAGHEAGDLGGRARTYADESEIGGWLDASGSTRKAARVGAPVLGTAEERGAIEAKIEIVARIALEKCLGPKAWALVREHMTPDAKESRAEANGMTFADSFKTAEFALTVVRNILGGVEATSSDAEESDVAMLKKAIGTVEEDSQGGGWLQCAVVVGSGGAVWNAEAAQRWRERGREIQKQTEGFTRKLTRVQACVAALWPWLDEKITTAEISEVKAALGTRKMHWEFPAYADVVVASSPKLVGKARLACKKAAEKVGALLENKAVKNKPTSNVEGGAQPAASERIMELAQAARKAADGAVSSLAGDAMFLADARLAHWARALGFEDAAERFGQGKWDSVTLEDWARWATLRRAERPKTPGDGVWAALESRSEQSGAGASAAARAIAGALGLGGEEIEAFAKTESVKSWAAFFGRACPAETRGAGPLREGVLWLAAFVEDSKSTAPALNQAWSVQEMAQVEADPACRRVASWARLLGGADELAAKAGMDSEAALALASSCANDAGQGARAALARAVGGAAPDLGGELRFVEPWDPRAEPSGLDGEAESILKTEGFAGGVARIAAAAGATPALSPGQDARSRANAWLGAGKSWATAKLGVGESSWRAVRELDAAAQEQVLFELMLGLPKKPAWAKSGQSGGAGALGANPFEHVFDLLALGRHDDFRDFVRGADGAERSAIMKEVLRRGAAHLSAQEPLMSRGVNKSRPKTPGVVSAKIERAIDALEHAGGAAKAKGEDKEFRALGTLLARAAKSGAPARLALGVAAAMGKLESALGEQSGQDATWWGKALAPGKEGARLTDLFGALSEESRARSEKIDVLMGALLERSAQPGAKAALATLPDMADWVGDMAGRFWRELPRKFGFAALERGSAEWHREASLSASQGGRAWRPLGAGYFDAKSGAEARELCTSEALAEEGRAMSHCVGSYSSVCISGNSRIFSLRSGGKRLATLQLSSNGDGTLRIEQLRGQCNAAPSKMAESMGKAVLARANEALKESSKSVEKKGSSLVWESEGFDPAAELASRVGKRLSIQGGKLSDAKIASKPRNR